MRQRGEKAVFAAAVLKRRLLYCCAAVADYGTQFRRPEAIGK